MPPHSGIVTPPQGESPPQVYKVEPEQITLPQPAVFTLDWTARGSCNSIGEMASRKRAWVSVALLMGIGLIYAAFIPMPEYDTKYRAVALPRSGKKEFLKRKESYQQGKPQFLIQDEILYLEVGRIRPTWLPLGITYRFKTQWDLKTLKTFRQSHPGLEPHWPERERPDGGARWIPRTRPEN